MNRFPLTTDELIDRLDLEASARQSENKAIACRAIDKTLREWGFECTNDMILEARDHDQVAADIRNYNRRRL